VSGWLVVRSADRVVALPVGQVEELVTVPAPLPVPAVVPAVRGVAPFRGRLVPLVHLAAALSDGPPPPEPGITGVAVRVGGRRVLLEVDDATELSGAEEEPLPHGWRGRWAAGAVRQAGTLVPILDFAWLAERLAGGAESATA
jgi:chemotaxis signal transduction protein